LLRRAASQAQTQGRSPASLFVAQSAVVSTTFLAPAPPTRSFVPGHAFRLVLSLGSGLSGGAAAVSWWNDYMRAGGHHLFTANDREPTGIARCLSGFEIVNPVVAQRETGNNRDCELRIANPLVGTTVCTRPHPGPGHAGTRCSCRDAGPLVRPPVRNPRLRTTFHTGTMTMSGCPAILQRGQRRATTTRRLYHRSSSPPCGTAIAGH
jgi:hypothetical protein